MQNTKGIYKNALGKKKLIISNFNCILSMFCLRLKDKGLNSYNRLFLQPITYLKLKDKWINKNNVNKINYDFEKLA